MNRRHFVAGIALASSFVELPAFAQNTAPTAALPHSDVEAKYQSETLQTGTLSLETSKVAQELAHNPKVKQFASFEVAEQQTIAALLKGEIQNGTGEKSPYPAPRGTKMSGNAAAPQTSTTPEMASALQSLQSLKGDAFDREYLKRQMDVHQRLLSIQENYISIGKAPETLAIATLARTVIKEHLTLLQDAMQGS